MFLSTELLSFCLAILLLCITDSFQNYSGMSTIYRRLYFDFNLHRTFKGGYVIKCSSRGVYHEQGRNLQMQALICSIEHKCSNLVPHKHKLTCDFQHLFSLIIYVQINHYQPSNSLSSINLFGDEVIHFKTHHYYLHAVLVIQFSIHAVSIFGGQVIHFKIHQYFTYVWIKWYQPFNLIL